jgi:hypothetical protein
MAMLSWLNDLGMPVIFLRDEVTSCDFITGPIPKGKRGFKKALNFRPT